MPRRSIVRRMLSGVLADKVAGRGSTTADGHRHRPAHPLRQPARAPGHGARGHVRPSGRAAQDQKAAGRVGRGGNHRRSRSGRGGGRRHPLPAELPEARTPRCPSWARERHPGGLSGTALVAARRMGRAVAYAGTLGDDELSRFILDGFQAEGVSVEHVVRRNGDAALSLHHPRRAGRPHPHHPVQHAGRGRRRPDRSRPKR